MVELIVICFCCVSRGDIGDVVLARCAGARAGSCFRRHCYVGMAG